MPGDGELAKELASRGGKGYVDRAGSYANQR